MMKQFAIVFEGRLLEVVPEFVEVERPAEGGVPVTVLVPLGERYHPDMVASMIPYDPVDWPDSALVAPTEAQVVAERDALLGLAAMRVAPLQDAVDLDQATAAELSQLKKWKQYRVALNRLTEQQGFPADVEWPAPPQ